MRLTCTARTAGTGKGIADCGFRICGTARRTAGRGTGDRDGACQNGRDFHGDGSRDGGTEGRRRRQRGSGMRERCWPDARHAVVALFQASPPISAGAADAFEARSTGLRPAKRAIAPALWAVMGRRLKRERPFDDAQDYRPGARISIRRCRAGLTRCPGLRGQGVPCPCKFSGKRVGWVLCTHLFNGVPQGMVGAEHPPYADISAICPLPRAGWPGRLRIRRQKTTP
jgi:hypothetical protein